MIYQSILFLCVGYALPYELVMLEMDYFRNDIEGLPALHGVFYLAACSHRPYDPSGLMLPRIPLARLLPHIREWSHYSCCEVQPPAVVFETQI